MLEFFAAAIKLKEINRQGWIQKASIKNPESVADHTYVMALMGMTLSDIQGFDTVKVIKMILLHDLAESEIGDLVPGQIPLEEKQELESKAFSHITKHLPLDLKQDYQHTWEEYCIGQSPEAHLVRQLDKLEMALQAKHYKTAGYDVDMFIDSAREYITDPKLKELFETIFKT